MKYLFIKAAIITRKEAISLIQCEICEIYYDSRKLLCPDCSDEYCPNCITQRLSKNDIYLQCNNCGQLFDYNLKTINIEKNENKQLS